MMDEIKATKRKPAEEKSRSQIAKMLKKESKTTTKKKINTYNINMKKNKVGNKNAVYSVFMRVQISSIHEVIQIFSFYIASLSCSFWL